MFGLTLSDWADLAEVISGTSIVGGLIFGVYQIKNMQEQQRDNIAITLSQTFYDKDFSDAVALLQSVPDGISLAELRKLGPEYNHAAVSLCTSFETMGLLAFKGIAPMNLVLDLAGGIVTTTNRKLSQWLIDLRIELNQPSFAEWFQWLGEQAEREKTTQVPAYVAYRDWRL